MQLPTAISLIQPALAESIKVAPRPQTWADIGAGTGLFTQALDQILPAGSTLYALDKSPHSLWSLHLERCQLRVTEGDFEQKMADLPEGLDGILMANALHYTPNPENVLKNLYGHLRPYGKLILIEYDTDQPRPPWVPYPISKKRLEEVAPKAGWDTPEQTGGMPSAYGHSQIYVAKMNKPWIPTPEENRMWRG